MRFRLKQALLLSGFNARQIASWKDGGRHDLEPSRVGKGHAGRLGAQERPPGSPATGSSSGRRIYFHAVQEGV
jgi:hypothetical protein